MHSLVLIFHVYNLTRMHVCVSQVFFVESICDDPDIIEENIKVQ